MFRSSFIREFKKDFERLGIRKIIYVSDGAAGQYKNYKNFANLMHHKEEYGYEAEWHFTATSHGKSTCDAISAVVKCHTRRESLKGTFITTAREMYLHCDEKLSSATLQFIWVPKDSVSAERATLRDRYGHYHSIEGTRKYHMFKPKDNDVIVLARTSDSTTVTEINFKEVENTDYGTENLIIGKFYAFVEAKNYQVGMLVDDNIEIGEATFNYLKMNRHKRILEWPEPFHLTYIPHRDILLELRDPIQNDDGVSLTIEKDQHHAIRGLYNLFKSNITTR